MTTTQKLQYFEKAENDRQQAFLEDQNHCALCGSVLETEHKIEKRAQTVLETAHCPSCGIRNRAREFTLH